MANIQLMYYLHSTMVIFKHPYTEEIEDIDIDLHSTMVIFKLIIFAPYFSINSFTFHYGYI